MNNTTLPYWLALMVLFAAGYGGWKWWQVQQFEASRSVGGITMSGPPLEEFTLTERSGEPFHSRDMLGKVWVATLFFTTCPGACPRLNANIKQLNSLEELHDVTWVSITVDPETDTLPKLQEYADRFSADPERWLFCRGEFGYVKRVGEDFLKVEVSWRGHKDYAVVIDKSGHIRGMYDAIRTSQLSKLRTSLLECLEEEGPDTPVEIASPENTSPKSEAPVRESTAA